MRRILIVISLFISLTSYSQEYSTEALMMKKGVTEQFNIIKKEAMRQWGDEPYIAIIMINQECEAFLKFPKLMQQFNESQMMTIYKAMLDNSYTGYCEYNMEILATEPMKVEKLHINWYMLVLTLQMKADAYKLLNE